MRNLQAGGEGSVTHMLAGRNSNVYLGGRLVRRSLLDEGGRAGSAGKADDPKISSTAALLLLPSSKSSL